MVRSTHETKFISVCLNTPWKWQYVNPPQRIFNSICLRNGSSIANELPYINPHEVIESRATQQVRTAPTLALTASSCTIWPLLAERQSRVAIGSCRATHLPIRIPLVHLMTRIEFRRTDKDWGDRYMSTDYLVSSDLSAPVMKLVERHRIPLPEVNGIFPPHFHCGANIGAKHSSSLALSFPVTPKVIIFSTTRTKFYQNSTHRLCTALT